MVRVKIFDGDNLDHMAWYDRRNRQMTAAAVSKITRSGSGDGGSVCVGSGRGTVLGVINGERQTATVALWRRHGK